MKTNDQPMGRQEEISVIPKKIYRDQLVTISDLDAFKEDLLISLVRLIKEQTAKPAKKWLKSYEVKEMLKISTGTLHALRKSGTLPFTKIGSLVYYDTEEIEKMLSSRNPGAKVKFLSTKGKT